jgi:hypothetical protein
MTSRAPMTTTKAREAGTKDLLHRRRQGRQAEVMRRRGVRVSASRSSFAGFRFTQVVAVRWYLRYGLSHDVEELLAERGIVVDHVSVYRWAQQFTRCWLMRHAPGDRWFVDETSCRGGRAVGLPLPRDRPVRAGH